MATRRILISVSAPVLCLAACSSAGTAIRSSSGPSVDSSAGALPHHRTVVLDPSTGNVVEPGTPGSPTIVILSPVTGHVVRLIR